MTLVEFRYLVALAAEANFSRAAQRCNVSQPTLSVAIAKIEDEFGVQLFERTKGMVRPTDAGIKVVEQASIALREAEKVRQIARYGRDQLAGPLRLGVIHTVGPYLLPQLVTQLRAVAPSMPLVIEENMTAALAGLLHENEIDAAILALPFDQPGVHITPLYDEPFLVVVPSGHRWESRATINPEEVTGEEVLLLKAGNCFRDQVLGVCPQVSSAETDFRLGHSIGTLRSMVASGLGVSILPASSMQHPFRSELISIIPFNEPEPTRRVVLVWRKGFVRPQAIDVLAAAVRKLHSPVFRMVG
jgi:LysR family hydrogen peroxide-inducible transcriptional activator